MEKGFKYYVQRFGKFMSGMIMPMLGAFIAWGLITAFVIPTGWTPNETLLKLVDPMIFYMIPLLIAYNAGKLVHGRRGAVIAVIATMGVIVYTTIVDGETVQKPMLIGAMIMGPLASVALKYVDRALDGKIPTGFEMLVNNFTLGILGALFAILGLIAAAPVIYAFMNALGSGVEWFVNKGLLPLASVIIEPAKVLFLNNAINHGVLTPLGAEQVAIDGQSIFYLLEANPGPGLGILVAYLVFGKGLAKETAPATIIIHFFGGIHEVYFPYVLMKPLLIVAVILGGATGIFVFNIFDVGLVAPASPGSIIAAISMAAKGSLFGLLLGILASAGVTFLVASVIIKADKSEDDFEEAKEKMVELKGSESKYVKTNIKIEKIAFACDAGMGSSAMGASALRNKFKKAGINVEVTHCSLEDIPRETQLVVTHKDLAKRAKVKAPQAEIVTIDNFVGAPEYDQLVERFK